MSEQPKAEPESLLGDSTDMVTCARAAVADMLTLQIHDKGKFPVLFVQLCNLGF